ncbi:MAG: 3-oxoacyl-ACP reductase FabG [Desulfobacterales bacterium]|nr:3-oxoacyl-ACP reductase FabG [Desulfobacterales bacterium]
MPAEILRLKDKVAIVTGGGYGIGRAYAMGMAAEGAKVVIADINLDAARKAAADIQTAGGEALPLKIDVSSEKSTLEMAEKTKEHFGRIDILINNAAIFGRVKITRVPFYELDLEEWDRVFAVNLKGTLLCCRAVFPQMKARQSGKIINISSSGVLFGNPNYVHYVASKAGIIGLTRSLARELGAYNINVNCLLPGATVTEDPNDKEAMERRLKRFENNLLPKRCLKRVQYPDSLVGAIIFLASAESDFMTGQSIVVDGGDMLH